MSVQFYQEMLSWVNSLNNTHISLSDYQHLLQNYPPPPPPSAFSDDLQRRLDLLILPTKRYIYSCKIDEKNPNNLQFLKGFRHGIWSYFCHRQNYLQIE